jgi:hypothetical protein
VKVYVRGPGLDPRSIRELWRRLYQQHGNNLHTRPTKEQFPVGLETMLVRTFGVFLTDGSYADSLWPEEVIIRWFKYTQETLDAATSDFRGTNLYQYKLSRSALIADPGSLGLRRIREDEPQFFGFFGDVPDPRNSYSNTVTTMRSNCITCHSELLYGLSTIFSFERNPDPLAGEPLAAGMLVEAAKGRYRLMTAEGQALLARLGLSPRTP